MNSYKKFSLIVATLGRDKELDDFLQSISEQEYPKDKIEVIIVDQNIEPILDAIVNKYKDFFYINHIRSNVVGLSKNRNIGIKASTGEIVAFPDDDCLYPKETLGIVNNRIQYSNVQFVLGRIWDNKKNTHAFRTWPSMNKKINKINFYRLTSSITMFSTDTNLYFDEKFGVGAQFGSNEDAAYIYSLLRKNSQGEYLSDLVLYHADQPIQLINQAKVASYSFGFGRFVREYLSWQTCSIFFLSIAYQSFGFFICLLKNNKLEATNRFISIKYRVLGLISSVY